MDRQSYNTEREKDSLKWKDRLLLVGVLFLMLFLLFIAFKPTLTGMSTFDGNVEKVLVLNKIYTNSTIEQLEINGTITSIRFNGHYVGEFKLWLNDSGKLLLIAQSDTSSKSANLITGLDVSDVGEPASSPISSSVPESSKEPISSSTSVLELPVEDSTSNSNESSAINSESPPSVLPNDSISNNISNDVIENLSIDILNETNHTSEKSTINESITNISIVNESIVNESVTNISINESMNSSTMNDSINRSILRNLTENQTISIYNITGPITSLDMCIDTCKLNVNMMHTDLVIVLSENSTLSIDSIIYTTKNVNHSPVQIKDIGDVYLNDTNVFRINLSDYFVDEDSDNLTFDSNTVLGVTPIISDSIITYFVSNISNNYSMFVYASDGENLVQSNVFHILVNISNTSINETNSTNITIETIQYSAVVGEPVKWIKKVHSQRNVTNISLDMPVSASNISLFKLDKGVRKELKKQLKNISRQKYKTKDTKNFTLNSETSTLMENTTILLNDSTDNVEVEYYTEAPGKSEKMLSKNAKEVTVSSSTHYTNVTAYATLPVEVKDLQSISLKWRITNDSLGNSADNMSLTPEELSELSTQGFIFREIPFIAYDTNNNSLYDKIEWVAPHLSNQTFEIIIITKAEHLDKNRNYISDIYEQVKSQDEIWSEVIHDGEYVRVTYERNLTNKNDITFYARSNDSGIVEVYEKNSTTKIADFGTIGGAQWYKIYLTNLIVPQDTFDLKVVNGDVEFDYIVDPDTPPNITYDGNYTIYTFKANGTFSPPVGITSVSVLVVAGGGGGASFSGGGGAGGLIYNSTYAINGSNISVVVGDGGAGSSTSDGGINGLNGGNSVFGNITATGGGGGGSRNTGYVGKAGNNGGSGGGGAPGDSGILGTGGNASPVGQGNNGGYETSFGWGGCGGGGAGAVGGNASGNTAGAGGTGLNYTINGSNVYYAGGGGGGTYSGGGTAAAGGNGGGGNGSKTGNGDAGVANTGGGGGGSGYQLTGGKGGSGIVIVRFLTAIPDTIYPSFSNYKDNSASLTDSGIGLFNVTINNTNGTVLLEINNTNITATNLTSNVYNASYNFTSSGVYIYRWHSWGNGTNHNYNNSGDLSYIVNATIDVSPPIITLISPLDYANLSSTVSFNCTMSDVSGLKNSTLYGNWSGGWYANQTQAISGLVNSTIFTKTILDGKYTWNCFACDVIGNCGFAGANKTFTIDTIPPSISIIYPSNNSNFSYKNISINYVVSDSNNVQACWYTNNSGVVNYSISNCANLTAQNWSEGVNNIIIYANDSVGNTNSSSVSFRVDTTAPSISIIYPQAITYYVNVSNLNYTSSETGNCWYSNNSGLWNSTPVSTGTNFSNMTSIEGANTWTVYCNDSLGNINSTSMTFFKDTTPLIINFTYPTPQNGTTTSNTSLIVNVSISKSNLQEVRYNWNGTNFTMYNDSLLLMMNFDNLSSLGESNTKVVDLSKYGNNGTVNGGAIWTASGKYGGAYNCGSAGSSISLTGIATPSEYTISLWKLFPLPVSADGWRTVIAKTSGNYHHILFDVNGNIGVYNAGFFDSGYNTNSLSGWHLITSTATGTTTLFYIDGVYVGTSSTKISTSDISGIGNYVVGGGQWSGALDELRIWNRVLSSSEIQQIYMSNLQKFNPTQWSLYINQSKNATSSLDNGTYTYQAFASDITGNNSQTEMRYFTVGGLVNTPPTIAYVQNITAQNPMESSTKLICVNFTVNDADGNSTINISSAKVVLNNSGLFRNTTQCSGVAINATAQNISCNLSLQYYDPAGIWNINISIADTMGNYTTNASTTFTYNMLYAVALNTNLLDFGALNAGDKNKTAGVLQLNNTGNFNYTLVQLKAYDLANNTNILSISNFRINITNVSIGTILSNNTFINITGATLPRSTDTSVGNQSMYIYVDVPLGTAAKKYVSISEWVLSLS